MDRIPLDRLGLPAMIVAMFVATTHAQDSAPNPPAPVQPAPVQPAPVQPAPVQPAPVQPATVPNEAEPNDAEPDISFPEIPLPNVVSPTLGGKQFWSDVRIFHQWRIQRNVFTNHCRLLDNENNRHAWGARELCEKKLREIITTQNLQPMSGTVVLILHGTIRSRGAMEPTCEFLRNGSDYTVLNVSYASTRTTIADHAKSLGDIIDGLDGVQTIHLVAHSMGNLVIRHYFGDHLPATQIKRPDPRIKRVVMLAPPNHQPQIARTFKANPVYQVIWGTSGQEMARWNELQPKLAIPTCQFGILAGKMKSSIRSNPLIDGNDDLVVAVQETRLQGAADFRTVEVNHSTIMRNEQIQEFTLNFLRHGYFTTARQRQPITEKVKE